MTMKNEIPPVGAYDVFRNIDSWDAEQARYWVNALNQRATTPDQISLRAYILEQSDLKPGETVLEIGCGTGRLLSDLAQVIGPSGHAFGLEPQSSLAKESERHISELKLDVNTRILCERAEKISLPDSSVDICIAQTVLVHIPVDILPKVFIEVKRVLKPGGRFISIDQDGDTWIIDHPLRSLTRKVIQFNSDYRYADGWIGRYLRRLFKHYGFEDIHVKSWNHTDTESGSYLYEMAHRIAGSAAEHGTISQDECKQWLVELDKLVTENDFFSSICFFCCNGKKRVQ